ncbi:MAG TPA: hypothetical protein VNW29_05435 [Candidatus Sulfotelmatobacter sp.]|jgi:hypothetical protein|nr:hypothetical protein [Candidatus Sulfotelmatobacter sp.]
MPEGEYQPRQVYTEVQNQPEISPIRDGLSAIVLPREIVTDEDPNALEDQRIGTEEVTIGKLNDFLQGLNRQGAHIVSIFDITFDRGKKGGVDGSVFETRKVAIVRKQPGEGSPPPTSDALRYSSTKP